MNQFVKFISQFISLSNEDTIALENVLSNKSYKAGDKIVQEGSICNSILFTVSGKARSYFVNHEGQEFTWNFHFNDADSKFENYFLVDYYSFLRQTPSHLTIEALEDIEAITLSYTNIQKIVSKSINLEKVASIMSATAYENVHKRAFTLLTSNAKERYLQLLKDEPYLLNKFQHYLIASYLGVAPQSLSRLRKEISKP
ncbi:Crp/Fnr family transcriptional regulator [Flavobacterium sp.]|jgi:CRP-like cAMP-binding protein|uniref:Crp/Fnr family transcriptional regulator n=1 Tax=Flavobacterium sp. TaxID=239 RepID=UPI0022BFD58C|nr:Crp/Fnr family transcriptional regulator [Flavobacterium sp.]MCZ8296577.1 Crp/Fnr family transcriptional regulator [Flavobacterium sp.]